MTTHPLWRPFQLIDPAEVDNRLLMPRRAGEITVVSPDPPSRRWSRLQTRRARRPSPG
jgi:hypothetical protein